MIIGVTREPIQRSKCQRSRSHSLSDSCWHISRERKDPETPPKLVLTAKVANPIYKSAQFKGQRSKVKDTRLTNVDTEMCHIF